jgi:hypothetical protein
MIEWLLELRPLMAAGLLLFCSGRWAGSLGGWCEKGAQACRVPLRLGGGWAWVVMLGAPQCGV